MMLALEGFNNLERKVAKIRKGAGQERAWTRFFSASLRFLAPLRSSYLPRANRSARGAGRPAARIFAWVFSYG